MAVPARWINAFKLILPGANPRDRLIACCGALLAIGATGAICHGLLPYVSDAPVLIAPMGASAVLLFAVPASPLAQPWPIIGGNTVSALVGVLVAHFVADPMLAGAIAVALAIAVMSATRCLHPPGGAAALTAVLGGHAVALAGFGFVLFPVAVNSALLVAAGWLFHRISGHSYPHARAGAAPNTHASLASPHHAPTIVAADVDDAIEDFGEALDVSREDLRTLLLGAEIHAMTRLHGSIACRDVMADDVSAVPADMHPRVARATLLLHGCGTLPVVDDSNTVIGSVGHEQLDTGAARAADVMVPAVTERPETPVFRLLGHLLDERAHDVVITDEDGRLVGMVRRTDVLLAMTRAALLPTSDASADASGSRYSPVARADRVKSKSI